MLPWVVTQIYLQKFSVTVSGWRYTLQLDHMYMCTVHPWHTTYQTCIKILAGDWYSCVVPQTIRSHNCQAHELLTSPFYALEVVFFTMFYKLNILCTWVKRTGHYCFHEIMDEFIIALSKNLSFSSLIVLVASMTEHLSSIKTIHGIRVWIP